MRILERPADHKFTYSYSQPEDYRFCQDSVIFPRVVAERVKVDENSRVLDLCAGCGVIGFELSFYLPQIRCMDFVEIQDAFRPHFEENLRLTGKDFRFLNMNYAELLRPEFAGVYDLIIANPPYFDPRQGKPSPVEINNRARFFVDSDFETLIRVVRHSLKPFGEAFLLVKDAHVGAGEVIADIRGTKAIRLVNIP